MLNLDKVDIINYLTDYIKVLIEVNTLDWMEIWLMKFIMSLSIEELIDKDLMKCFWILLEEFEFLNEETQQYFIK